MLRPAASALAPSDGLAQLLNGGLLPANQGRPADKWLAETVRWTWKVKLLGHLELDAEQRLREQAEAALRTAVGAVAGLAAHGHDLNAWLGDAGMDLSWR